MTPDKARRELHEIIDELVKKKIDTQRRYVDEILEKVQEQNRTYFLDRMKMEIDQATAAVERGDLQEAKRHKVLAETYKAIVERCFVDTQ